MTLLENDRERYARLEERFEHVVRYGDATELFVLERAGVERADLVVAVTGDDEDNVIVCQVAKEKYGVAKCIARVNDPRNQPHFEMVGIGLTVSATATILALIEHELPAARAGDAARPAPREPRDRRVRDRRPTRRPPAGRCAT